MNSSILGLLLLGAIASVYGMYVAFRGLRNSPEGYEDSEGFHYGRPSEELIIRTAVVRSRSRSYEHQTAA